LDPDIHWSPISSHIGTFVANGGRFDTILHTEDLKNGMEDVLQRIQTPFTVDLTKVPRFNEGITNQIKREYPVADFFDDLSAQMVWDMYKKDFSLFGYNRHDPTTKIATKPIDINEIHAKLAH
jgi:hypothetical protein